jgi:hypothetical protein
MESINQYFNIRNIYIVYHMFQFIQCRIETTKNKRIRLDVTLTEG